jgi:hypothetical protein
MLLKYLCSYQFKEDLKCEILTHGYFSYCAKYRLFEEIIRKGAFSQYFECNSNVSKRSLGQKYP